MSTCLCRARFLSASAIRFYFEQAMIVVNSRECCAEHFRCRRSSYLYVPWGNHPGHEYWSLFVRKTFYIHPSKTVTVTGSLHLTTLIIFNKNKKALGLLVQTHGTLSLEDIFSQNYVNLYTRSNFQIMSLHKKFLS